MHPSTPLFPKVLFSMGGELPFSFLPLLNTYLLEKQKNNKNIPGAINRQLSSISSDPRFLMKRRLRIRNRYGRVAIHLN